MVHMTYLAADSKIKPVARKKKKDCKTIFLHTKDTKYIYLIFNVALSYVSIQITESMYLFITKHSFRASYDIIPLTSSLSLTLPLPLSFLHTASL